MRRRCEEGLKRLDSAKGARRGCEGVAKGSKSVRGGCVGGCEGGCKGDANGNAERGAMGVAKEVQYYEESATGVQCVAKEFRSGGVMEMQRGL